MNKTIYWGHFTSDQELQVTDKGIKISQEFKKDEPLFFKVDIEQIPNKIGTIEFQDGSTAEVDFTYLVFDDRVESWNSPNELIYEEK